MADAKAKLSHAADAADARRAADDYAAKDKTADEKRRAAELLDQVVNTLTHVAPKELAARAQMIPGVAFVGADLTFDGIGIDDVNSAKQMELSIQIAKRANRQARFLVVDGMEKINPSNRRRFIELAIADGWQLIGTIAEDGELRTVAIEA